MALVYQKFNPLIEQNVAAPTLTQHALVLSRQSTQRRVSRATTELHCLGKFTVEIDSDFHVRICNAHVIVDKKIRQRQCDCVATSLQYLKMQIALARHARFEIAIKAAEFGYELLKTKIVTLVQGHQADKAIRLYDGLRYKLMIE